MVSKQFREPLPKKIEGAENTGEIANSFSGGDFKRPSDYRRMSIVMQRSKECKSKGDLEQKSATDIVGGDKTVLKDDLLADMNTLLEVISW